MKNKTEKNRLFSDFCRYCLVGLIATAVEYAVFCGLSYLGCHYEISTVTGYLIATFFNWLAGKIILFTTCDKPLYKEILSVYIASIIGLLLNTGIMWLAVDILDVNKYISKIVATAIVFLWNFYIRKKVIYKNSQKAKT